MKVFLFSVLIALTVLGCKKKNEVDQAKVDDEIIKEYVSDRGLSAKKTGSGLYYVIEEEGTGTRPSSSSTVKAVYRGYFTSGEVFDQSSSQGTDFALGSVIEGWQEGIPLIKEEGSIILIIPSALGYGAQAKGSIPANSVLVFDVDLLEVL